MTILGRLPASFCRSSMLAVLAITCATSAPALALEPEVVRFTTDDDVSIVGDLYVVDQDAPTVVCLPMFRHDRSTWRPLAAKLNEAGLNVLAIDLRGHGDSAPEFLPRVKARDVTLFNAMHLDVKAAIQELDVRGFDTTRVALCGASVGCSVAIASAVGQPGPVRAVVLMTPGAHYLGVDTLADLERWRGVPTLVLTSTEEEAKVRPVATALQDVSPLTEVKVVSGKGIHGTRMFGVVKGIEDRIAGFFRNQLLPDALLLVPRFAAENPLVGTAGFVGRTLRVTRGPDAARFTLMAFAVGDALTLGTMVKGAFRGEVRWTVGERVLTHPFDTTASGEVEVQVSEAGTARPPFTGQQAAFRGTTWVQIDMPAASCFPKGEAKLRLELLPAEGATLTLPSAGVFQARLTDAK